ncbi:hypothetical protein CEXT_520761 [Caerostris extrusa]|uniref:Uncharacterized protein n=1 Tax=Caerostris extrusa TaxID=172846 RepID=A0AAV4M6G2_CAEEX|nr:hypothetical protein CEXT_520761 [Caerostris extrusa]
MIINKDSQNFITRLSFVLLYREAPALADKEGNNTGERKKKASSAPDRQLKQEAELQGYPLPAKTLVSASDHGTVHPPEQGRHIGNKGCAPHTPIHPTLDSRPRNRCARP